MRSGGGEEGVGRGVGCAAVGVVAANRTTLSGGGGLAVGINSTLKPSVSSPFIAPSLCLVKSAPPRALGFLSGVNFHDGLCFISGAYKVAVEN